MFHTKALFLADYEETKNNHVIYVNPISLLPTGMVTAPSGDATTTFYLEATKAAGGGGGQHPLGILTSIVDTFINGGTTTEYMTQHIGTHIDTLYAKVATTSSREYYRISPTASQDYDAPARPTGLIGSSTSLEAGGV